MNKLKKHCRILPKGFLRMLILGAVLTFSGGLYPSGSELNAKSDISNDQQQAKERIQGKVIDDNGDPLIGVSVVLKSGGGTITDIDGNFSFEASPDDEVTFRYVGYTSITRKVGSDKTINITMKTETNIMEEIVVVGYGSQKKENLTGSVFSVDVEKTLGSRPIADVGRGLQGTVPGLSVVVASGEIGSDPIMKIRGQVASLNGSSNPLILYDNVEIPSIQVINPDDIESISVLKDAASTSIYGAKAAFGVILITSKKGTKTESISINYSGNFSWQDRAKSLNMAGIDGMQYIIDAAKSRDPNTPTISADGIGSFWKIDEASLERSREWLEKYGNSVKPGDPMVFNRDWYVTENGRIRGVRIYDPVEAMVDNWTPTMQHNLSINGRTGKTTYYLGLGFLDQSGMVKTAEYDDFKKYNATLRVSSEINKYITVRGGAMFNNRTKRYPSQGTIANDPWYYAYRWGPWMPVGVKDQHGNYLQEPAHDMAFATTSSMRNTYMNLNLGASVNITQNWNLEFDYNYSRRENITRTSFPTFHVADIRSGHKEWKDEEGNRIYVDEDGNIVPEGTEGSVAGWTFATKDLWTYGVNNSSISRNSTSYDYNTFNAYSTYDLNLQDSHAFKFMLGLNSEDMKYEGHYAGINDLLDFDNPQFAHAVGEQYASGSAGWNSLFGVFGRVNYSFRDKYLLEANLRYDGTSKFPKQLQWKWYPSFSAGWVLTSEEFMKPLESILSFAKIRGSYGIIGDQSVANNLYVPRLSKSQISWLDDSGKVWSYGAPTLVDRNIGWQNIAQTTIGADLRFLKHSPVGVTFEWFQRDTKDMLIAGDALPTTLGTSAPTGNYGHLRTRGWELTLDFNYRFSNGLSINGMANIWDATTKTVTGADWNTKWEDRGIANSFSTGATYGDIWGYVTDRLYQEEDFIRGEDGKLEKTTIIIDGVKKDSYKLAGPNPVYQTRLEDGGGVVIFRPGDVKFVDINGDGYITPGRGTNGDSGDRKVIGNSTPRYNYGFRLGADYKGFDFSIFFQGVGKREIWGAGPLAIPGFNLADGAVPQAIAGDYWREDRTDAFYPRPWSNNGANTNYSLQIQSRYLLDMSYLRIKNMTFGYSLPQNLLKKAYLSKARIYLSLENFVTWDNLRGLPIDPETISGYSMFSSNANAGRTGQGTPLFKSVSFGIQLGF